MLNRSSSITKYPTIQPPNSIPIVTVGSLMRQTAAETGFLVVPEEAMSISNTQSTLNVGEVILIDDGYQACIRTIDTIKIFDSAKELYESNFLKDHYYKEFFPTERASEIAKCEEKRYQCTSRYCLLTVVRR